MKTTLATPFWAFSETSAKHILSYAQQISVDDLSPLTIALLGEPDYGYIQKLHQLWQQQSRPWHIVLLDRHYQQCAWKKVLSQVSEGHAHALLPLPGLHRVDLEPYRFSVSMLFDESVQAWSKFSAQIHLFILNSPTIQDVRQALRMAASEALLYSPCVLSEAYETLCRQQQFLLNKSEDDGCIFSLTSRRPQLIRHINRQAMVVGAGVAGAGVAFALANRGWQVKVIDPILANSPDEEAYRYASGAVTPLITADDCHKARLSRAGVLRARVRWQSIADKVGIRYCGTLELNRDKGHAKDLLEAVQQLDFPKAWVRLVSAEEASLIAGVPINQAGAFFPWAMQIPPVRLARTLLQHDNIELVPSKVKTIRAEPSGAFAVVLEEGEMTTQVLVVATAMDSQALLQNSGLAEYILKSGQKVNALQRLDSLHPLGGEVMMVPADELGGGPRCVVGGQGYYLPAQEGFCVMGSTYEHGNLHPKVSKVGQETIWRKMPLDLPVTLASLQQKDCLKGRACVRAVLQGRLPVIAELPQYKNLWVATGYASHGMTWSSLAGDIIGASLEGEPLPIERDLFSAISFKI